MKKRLQNWITSVIGGLFLIAALGMYIADKMETMTFSTMEMLITAIFGYVLLHVKDELLEDLFFKIFKMNKK